jgi:hypothetical protein
VGWQGIDGRPFGAMPCLPLGSLSAVRAAAAQVRTAQARLDAAVQRARADGRSWGDIGPAAGMTHQSAHERWAGREELPALGEDQAQRPGQPTPE